jgi:hypothetical protein
VRTNRCNMTLTPCRQHCLWRGVEEQLQDITAQAEISRSNDHE